MRGELTIEVRFTAEPAVDGTDVARRAEAVLDAWARRDLPLDWLERGVAAVPGVHEVSVLSFVGVEH